jgi:hypothetical protein
MASEKEQKNYENTFLNPLAFWQNYLINLLQASRGFYENTIKANEYWFKAFWEPYLRPRAGDAEQKKGKEANS